MDIGNHDQQVEAWQKRIETIEKHMMLGQSLQAKGLNLLNQIQVVSQDDLSREVASVLKNATDAIDKGVKIESEASKTLLLLKQAKPMKPFV